MLTKEIMGYGVRGGIPQIHAQFKDQEGVVVVDANSPQIGDVPLADEAAYDAAVVTIQDQMDADSAAREVLEIAHIVALNALKTSGKANLLAGTPLTEDEANAVLYDIVP